MSTIKMGKYTVAKTHGRQEITSLDKPGSVTVYGNGHTQDTFYAVPDWSDDPEEAFKYRDNTYFLSEFMRISPSAPAWMRQFDGYLTDSFFSGILVKCDLEEQGYKAYMYIG